MDQFHSMDEFVLRVRVVERFDKGTYMKSLKKKQSKKDNLDNYTDVDSSFFMEVYKQYGNEKEYLKIIENAPKTRYLIWTEYLVDKRK